ncbi:alpha/beta fold hydrolase [Ornithinimicrobium sp. W1679]|uniref:alpha/beta fold hydrolase n=1 Tax=Ornithinimicrobium sp. W1679 TaxID=3418770 RepID=UPI003CF0C393
MIVNEDTSVDTAHEVGRGPRTVICLPGWFGSSTGWGQGFLDALDTESFRYEFMDYRGYGERRGSGGPYTIDQIAADVLELADDLGVRTFSLVGHSMGGSAVQRVLALAPDRVEAVVGIAPVPASGTPFDEEGRQLFESAAGDDTARETIVDLTTGKRLSARWIDQIVRHSRARSDEEAFAGYFTAWADTDHAADVPVDRVPALAVVGEHDVAVTEEGVRATWGKTHPSSTVVVMCNAGHYPMYETPVRLATILEEFLETHSVAAGKD